MNCFKYKIVLLLSVLTFCSCANIKSAQAQVQMRPPTLTSVLPPQPSASDLATLLTYKTETYDSKVMGGSRIYCVVLPPGYDQNQNQHYPVIFLLHGGNGNADHWFAKGDALTVLQQLYATGKLPPSIIITPDGNDKRGSSRYWDPDYIDGPNGKVSTAIGDELVKVVQNRYRTLTSPDFWAMGGLSSGGWGAMNVGLHNLNNFSILFSHSGYFQDKSGPQNSPITYIKTISPQAKKRLRIYLDAGIEDTEVGLDESKKFNQILSTEKIYNIFHAFPGGHTWNYWHEHLADSLTFVGRQFKISAIIHASDNLGFKKP
ncbi:alpha/beta hydrolase [Brasilonema bromeliae]|uniref:Esterase family protein n=1 Tax=Brasilonema bromeliae SPC951 TaxID=385972 RepID=A0ABX1P1I1_9CYAN|nr:alpha/beta hydrolase-fold protein [Brasilonema bromeliae]NMG18164.1 esterase family protein [Brasilonema bromeliae SPC951]